MKLIRPVPEKLVRDFEPQHKWLSHDSLIHGVDHMTRVFILQELICDKLEAQNISVNREALRWAASTHDVGRVDDGIDPNHGRNSTQWIKEHLSEQMSPEMLDVVTYIVHWHVPPDREAPVMTAELKVLKDADALDRVRIGDLDKRFLRTNAALELINIAEDLYNTYESTEGDDVFASVVKAAQTINVVEK